MILLAPLRALLIIAATTLSCILPYDYVYDISLYILWLLGIVEGKIEGKEYVEKAYKACSPFIVVFYHPTCFDHLVLYHSLRIPLRFVAKKSYIQSFSLLVDKFHIVVYDPQKNGTTDTIIRAVRREPEKGIIAIAPNGGVKYEQDPTYLPEFRKGAFVAGVPVLPVVINYMPSIPWKENISMFKYLWNRLKGTGVRYNVSILPLIYPNQDEDASVFAERTRQIMQYNLKNMEIPLPWRPECSMLEWLSSHTFMIAAFLFYLVGATKIALSVAFTSFLGIVYHSSNHPGIYAIDILVNKIHAVIYGSYFLWKGHYRSVILLLVAGVSYKNKWNHVFTVHIPVMAGWFIAAYEMWVQ